MISGAALLSLEDHKVNFGVSRGNHAYSSLSAPVDDQNFEFVTVEDFSLVKLIKRFGDPDYVKIDVEGVDYELANSLFENGIFPPFTSVEAHDPAVAALLMSKKCYRGFNLVEGSAVARRYSTASITSKDGRALKYRFPHHSAGPFGTDITTPWLEKG